jgi:hypothetical protein
MKPKKFSGFAPSVSPDFGRFSEVEYPRTFLVSFSFNLASSSPAGLPRLVSSREAVRHTDGGGRGARGGGTGRPGGAPPKLQPAQTTAMSDALQDARRNPYVEPEGKLTSVPVEPFDAGFPTGGPHATRSQPTGELDDLPGVDTS